MRTVKSLSIAIALLTLACNVLGQSLPFPGGTATATPDLGCPDPEPTQDFINSVLDHKGEHVESEDWERSYAVMESRVSVTWTNVPLGAVINIDHVIFCDVTSTRIDEYYVDSFFETLFQNYEAYEPVRECRANDLRLYEFKVKSSGFDYNARFWVELVDRHHTREVLLVFPIADLSNLTSYSQGFMPELPSCE